MSSPHPDCRRIVYLDRRLMCPAFYFVNFLHSPVFLTLRSVFERNSRVSLRSRYLPAKKAPVASTAAPVTPSKAFFGDMKDLRSISY